MKNCFLIYVIITASLASGCAGGINFTSRGEGPFPEEGVSTHPGMNLAAGEKLTYQVSWTGIPVGQLVLENHGLEKVKGVDVYHLTVRSVSNKFLSNFFPIEDTLHTWISRRDGVSLRFEKIIKEGHYSKHQVIELDHEKGEATYYRKDKQDRASKTVPIPPDVQDIFSVLYWLRWQPLSLGRELLLNVTADKKNWEVKVEVVDLGILKTGSRGRSMAYVLEPSAAHNGKALEKGKMRAWFSADRRRIPLAFQVNTPIFGRAYAVLSEAVLPPLPEEEPLEDDFFSRGHFRRGWLNGLTQSDDQFISR